MIVERDKVGARCLNYACVAAKAMATLSDAVAAFNPTERMSRQTIIRVRP